MKTTFCILLLLLFLATCPGAEALDFQATPESVWVRYVPTPVPERLTESQLRIALEWSILKGPVPRLSRATPYGIRLQYWNRVIGRMGLPAVADEYAAFLHQLRAALARGK